MPSPSRNRRSCIAITSVPRSFWGYIVYRCKHSACYCSQKYVVHFFDFFGWIGATVSTQKRCFRHLCLERPQETCKIRRGSIGSINLSPIDGKRWKKLENHGKIHHRSRFGSLGTSLNCSWWIQEAMFEDTGGYFQRNVFARMDGIDGWMTRWIIWIMSIMSCYPKMVCLEDDWMIFGC
jgi:hypothetical protein